MGIDVRAGFVDRAYEFVDRRLVRGDITAGREVGGLDEEFPDAVEGMSDRLHLAAGQRDAQARIGECGSTAGRDGVETFRLRRPAPDSSAVIVEAEATIGDKG